MSRIIIADNHALIRYSVRMLLERSGHSVVAETSSGYETLHMVKVHEPHLLIVELNLPQMHGLEVIAALALGKRKSRILVFTACDADNYLIRCLRAGASGFVSKTAEVSEIERAIQRLLRGRTYFPSVTLRVAQALKKYGSRNESKTIKLTRREREILDLFAKGHTSQSIAKLLMISHKTVSAYKVRLQYKFNTTHLLSMIDAACQGGHIKALSRY